MTVHLVEFRAYAEIVVGADGAARAHSKMRPIAHRRRGDRQCLVEIDPYLVGVGAGIDKNLSAMAVGLARLSFFVVGSVIAASRIAAVTHERGQAREVRTINVP